MSKIDEDGLKALFDQEVSNALGYVGKLSAQRQKALYYYYGEAKLELAPPEVDGRSSVVSNDTADTIEWIMPNLCKIFTSADDAVEFTPQGPEDEEGAEQATAFCNYVFYRQNPGFQIMHNWFKDALLQKAGIVKVWWDTREDVKKEEYEGLTMDELTLMAQDKAVEIVEARSYPDTNAQQTQPAAPAMQMGQFPGMQQPPVSMLYDVTVSRTKKSQQTRVENVPPEEFLISRRARTMDEPFFIAHRVMRTASDLRAMGYSRKEVDDLASDETWSELNPEHIERLSFDDEVPAFRSSEGGDPARRVIWLTEGYMPVDWDGDGIAELRRIVKCGTKILENEAVDDHPFCLITPILMPHRVIGLSMADVVADIHRIKTVLLRGKLDATYLSTNPRMYVDTTKNVNLDDLLMSRPGGLVRGQGPEGVTPLTLPDTSAAAMDGLMYMDSVLEDRTGVSKMTSVTDPNSLNKTATEVNAMQQASNQRIELIARVFAETGVKDLFRKILKSSQQNAQQGTMLRLNGKFVTVDPRTWKNQFDVSINVGLGTGNKDQIVQHMMMILQAQQQAAPYGLAQPKNVYEALKELTKAIGYKDTSQFWTDPSAPDFRPPPPQMPPEVQKAQIDANADITIAQGKAQTDQASEQARAQADMAIQQHKVTTQAALERDKSSNELALAKHKAELEQQTKMRSEYMAQVTALEVARIKAGVGNGAGIVEKDLMFLGMPGAMDQQVSALRNEMQQHVQALHGAIQSIATPKRKQVHRGPDGRAVAVQEEGKPPQMIVRDHTGKAVGVQ